MENIERIDNWFMALSGNMTVEWVRRVRLASNVLVYLVILLAGAIACVRVVVDRDPLLFGHAVFMALLVSQRLEMRIAPSLPLIRVVCLGFAVLAGVSTAHNIVEMLSGDAVMSHGLAAGDSVLITLAYYLARIPPMDPPPGKQRRALVFGEG